jgi:protein-S-isoprenylcysteine O-methyltransferase Ste14
MRRVNAMESDASGWMIFGMEVVGVIVLGAALAYGTWMWRTRNRNPVLERAREEASKRLFEQGQ